MRVWRVKSKNFEAALCRDSYAYGHFLNQRRYRQTAYPGQPAARPRFCWLMRRPMAKTKVTNAQVGISDQEKYIKQRNLLEIHPGATGWLQALSDHCFVRSPRGLVWAV